MIEEQLLKINFKFYFNVHKIIRYCNNIINEKLRLKY